MSADEVGACQDRAAPLLGLDARVGRLPEDADPQVGNPLALGHERAAGAGALEHERGVDLAGLFDDVRGGARRPDLLVGVGDERDPLERHRIERAAEELAKRRDRAQAGEQPGLHVGGTGRLHDPALGTVLDLERALGDRPLLEHRVHVPDEQDSWTRARPALEGADHRVAETAGGVGPALDGRPHRREVGGDQRSDLVHARRGVAPAVDRAKALEIGEERGQARLDSRFDRPQLVPGDERARRGGERHGGSHTVDSQGRAGGTRCYPRHVRLIEIRLLEGPNLYRLEPVVKLEVAIGRRRTWYGRRDPEPHMLVRLAETVPASDLPSRVAALVAWVRRLRREHPDGCGRARAGPSIVRPGALDRDLPLGEGGPREGARRIRAGAGRAGGPVQGRGPPRSRPASTAGASRRAYRRRRRARPVRTSATRIGGCRSSRSAARTGRRPRRGSPRTSFARPASGSD